MFALNHRGRSRFTRESGERFFILRAAAGQKLQGYAVPQFDVDGGHDHAHSTFSQHSHDSVFIVEDVAYSHGHSGRVVSPRRIRCVIDLHSSPLARSPSLGDLAHLSADPQFVWSDSLVFSRTAHFGASDFDANAE
jgi:hypothetical protein